MCFSFTSEDLMQPCLTCSTKTVKCLEVPALVLEQTDHSHSDSTEPWNTRDTLINTSTMCACLCDGQRLSECFFSTLSAVLWQPSLYLSPKPSQWPISLLKEIVPCMCLNIHLTLTAYLSVVWKRVCVRESVWAPSGRFMLGHACCVPLSGSHLSITLCGCCRG